MIFFGDVATDLIGKPPDQLLNEFLASNEVLPSDIARLVGRSYVVDVVVSRLSIRLPTIDFQVVKFYTEGGSEYMDFVTANRPQGVIQAPRLATAEDNTLNIPSSSASPGTIPTTTSAAVSSIDACVGALADPNIGSVTSDPSKIDAPESSAPSDDVLSQTPQGQHRLADSPAAHTPPEDILEQGEKNADEIDLETSGKGGEQFKKKRGLASGDKPAASKKLFQQGPDAPSSGSRRK